MEAEHRLNSFVEASKQVWKFFLEEDPTHIFRQLNPLLQKGPKGNRNYKEDPEKCKEHPELSKKITIGSRRTPST